MVFVGIISYPLYLWHWPLLSFATILEARTPASLTRLTAVLISFVLAWLTFRFLERPVRAQRSARVTFSVVGALCISGLAGWVIYSASGFDARFDHDVRALRPEPRVNSLCRDQVPQEVDFNYCKSTSSARPLAVFLGDSRAQAVYEGVAAEIGSRYPMTLLARGGCPPLLNVPGANEQGCNDVWNHFVEYVEQSQPAVVVVVGGGSPLLRGPTAALAVHGIPFPIADETFKAGLGALDHRSAEDFTRDLRSRDSAIRQRPLVLSASREDSLEPLLSEHCSWTCRARAGFLQSHRR